MKCEVLPILPLRVKSAIYCTVFSDFLSCGSSSLISKMWPTPSFQLLVGFQQLFHFVLESLFGSVGAIRSTHCHGECSGSIQHLAALFRGCRGASRSAGERLCSPGAVVALLEPGVAEACSAKLPATSDFPGPKLCTRGGSTLGDFQMRFWNRCSFHRLLQDIPSHVGEPPGNL